MTAIVIGSPARWDALSTANSKGKLWSEPACDGRIATSTPTVGITSAPFPPAARRAGTVLITWWATATLTSWAWLAETRREHLDQFDTHRTRHFDPTVACRGRNLQRFPGTHPVVGLVAVREQLGHTPRGSDIENGDVGILIRFHRQAQRLAEAVGRVRAIQQA
jgi:hypothetical protein